MDLQIEYWAHSSEEWQRLWSDRPSPHQSLARPQRDAPTAFESLSSVCRSLARAMRGRGFRMYRNGGMPLLERWSGPWRQEILFRPGPAVVRGKYVPVEIQVHLTNDAVGDLRRRYLIADPIPSNALASGNIGELDSPPGWVLWNVAEPLAMDLVQDSLTRLALPWLSLLSDSEALDALLNGDVRLMDKVAAFEWVAVMYGRDEASHFLDYNLLTDESTKEEFDRTVVGLHELRGRAPLTTNVAQRLAIAAWSLDMIPDRYLWAV